MRTLYMSSIVQTQYTNIQIRVDFQCCVFCDIRIRTDYAVMFRTRKLAHSGPDLGMGKLGSCPGTSTTRGPPHISLKKN